MCLETALQLPEPLLCCQGQIASGAPSFQGGNPLAKGPGHLGGLAVAALTASPGAKFREAEGRGSKRYGCGLASRRRLCSCFQPLTWVRMRE